MIIRDIEKNDLSDVLKLNSAVEAQTSAINSGYLQILIQLSSFAKVAVLNGEIVGFVLAMKENVEYINANYKWFSENYKSFLYIDRVVVCAEKKGQGIGSAIYKELFEFAQREQSKHLVCEYNLEPLNVESKAFHDKFGFNEVGTQRVTFAKKLVSLQAANI